MTSSNGNIFRVTGPLWGIHRSSVNSPHKGQWRGALLFSLICAWINGWVNNRETGDLRRHRAPYDVIVMKKIARKSRPIQCVELDHQSGSRKQHCWKFWNPIERVVMPRYVFLYFLMSFAFFKIKIRLRCHSQHETESLSACYWVGGCLLTDVSKKNRAKGIKRG